MDMLDKLTNMELAVKVAEKRGCRIAKFGDKYVCKCIGMTHGKKPDGVLFIFPRDIAIGFLRFVPEKGEKQKWNPEGFNFIRIYSNSEGRILVEQHFPIHLQTLEFAFTIRGGLESVLDDIKNVIRSFKSKPVEKDQDDEIQNFLGSDDGVGPEGS